MDCDDTQPDQEDKGDAKGEEEKKKEPADPPQEEGPAYDYKEELKRVSKILAIETEDELDIILSFLFKKLVQA